MTAGHALYSPWLKMLQILVSRESGDAKYRDVEAQDTATYPAGRPTSWPMYTIYEHLGIPISSTVARPVLPLISFFSPCPGLTRLKAPMVDLVEPSSADMIGLGHCPKGTPRGEKSIGYATADPDVATGRPEKSKNPSCISTKL